MAGKGKKSSARRKPARRSKKVSNTLRRAIKQVVKRQVETKTINVPNPSGLANNNFVPYGALSGVQYLVTDLWKQPQGVEDSTTLGAPNRVGDKINAIGFLMDYYITIANYYTVGALTLFIPFVKVRITVFRQAFGTPLLSSPLLYDSNFNGTFTSTLQPINWDEGYVKDVLYDRVFIIRNTLSVQAAGSGTLPGPQAYGNVMHFKKYLKFPHPVKYTDNNTSTPNSTDKPVYIAISAEVDDANVGNVPSGTKILWTTGYTRGWFKDA